MMDKVVSGGVPQWHFHNDLNTSRMSSQHGMVRFVLVMAPVLIALAAKQTAEGKPPSWIMSAEAFLMLSEMETGPDGKVLPGFHGAAPE
jgi:hypothetical protein